MKVAISVFRNVVSPRLDSSDGLLIYDIDNDVVNKKEKCSLNFDQPAQLISILQKKKITTVICGGCPQFFLRMLFFHGVDVIAGVTGNPDSIINVLMKGKLKALPSINSFIGPCRHRTRLNRKINKEKRRKFKRR